MGPRRHPALPAQQHPWWEIPFCRVCALDSFPRFTWKPPPRVGVLPAPRKTDESHQPRHSRAHLHCQPWWRQAFLEQGHGGGQHSGLPGGPGTLHRSGRGPELAPPLPPPVQAAATGPAPHPHGDWQSLWPCPVRRGARDSWRCLETAVVTLGVGALTGHRRRRVFKSWPWGVSGSMAAGAPPQGWGCQAAWAGRRGTHELGGAKTGGLCHRLCCCWLFQT